MTLSKSTAEAAEEAGFQGRLEVGRGDQRCPSLEGVEWLVAGGLEVVGTAAAAGQKASAGVAAVDIDAAVVEDIETLEPCRTSSLPGDPMQQ